MRTSVLIPIFTIVFCAVVFTSGCVDSAGFPVNASPSGISSPGQNAAPPLSGTTTGNSDPDTVPVGTAFNETLASFWSFAIEGPYDTDPNWTSAYLDPEPVILTDISGSPEYYEFYLRNGKSVPGHFWTAANKILGHNVFRIYPSAPSYNYPAIVRDAETIVRTRYPDYPVLSNTPSLYGGSDLFLCARLIVRNTSSGKDERIIVDTFAGAIVPDHPSEDYKGHTYAWSYLDSIPHGDRPARIAQWKLADENATRIVDYALAQGIDPRLPLSVQNASIIRTYYNTESQATSKGAGSSKERDDSYLDNDGRPITDALIRENTVPAETARVRAQAKLWRRQVDQPDIYESLTYRDAILGSRNPVVIEDINGRTLFYLFSVERNGQHIDWIVTMANKIIGSWLAMPSDNYDFTNATRIARERAGNDFPGSTVESARFVYCNDATRGGLWMVQSLYNPSAGEKDRIIVDASTLNTTVEKNSSGNGSVEFPPLFSRVESGESTKWIWFWNKENKADQDLVAYARARGIPADRPLTDDEIVTLGSYIAGTTPASGQPEKVFNPLYPEPAVRPTLEPSTRAWHEQADWFSVFEVDASHSDDDIKQIVASHRIPGNYSLKIWPSESVRKYYLRVPEPEYNRTYSILSTDGSVIVPEQVSPLAEYVQILKQKNGTVTIPVRIGSPEEANYLHLIGQGIPVRPTKTVYIDYDYAAEPKKADRQNVLAELNADDRVLFVYKEYAT
jgi:hypothetical protein